MNRQQAGGRNIECLFPRGCCKEGARDTSSTTCSTPDREEGVECGDMSYRKGPGTECKRRETRQSR